MYCNLKKYYIIFDADLLYKVMNDIQSKFFFEYPCQPILFLCYYRAKNKITALTTIKEHIFLLKYTCLKRITTCIQYETLSTLKCFQRKCCVIGQ